MSWESEQGLEYEVPNFVQFLAKKGILEDSSWHNDTMPSFGVYDEKTDRKVVLWVDHPIRSRREHEGGTRFGIQVDDDTEYDGDDLQAALEHLFVELGKLCRPPRLGLGPKEWSPRGYRKVAQEWNQRMDHLLKQYSKAATSDWSYFLVELLHEFYAYHD